VHPAAGRSGKRSHQEITERRTRMRAAAFPLTDDVVTFGDQVRSAPELQVRKSLPKIHHEGLDVISASARLVQGILQEHVRCGDLIDHSEVAGLSPEICEPPANNRLVV